MLATGIVITGVKTALLSSEVLMVAGGCLATGVSALVIKYTERPDSSDEEKLIGKLTYLIITLILIGTVGARLTEVLSIVETIFFSF